MRKLVVCGNSQDIVYRYSKLNPKIWRIQRSARRAFNIENNDEIQFSVIDDGYTADQAVRGRLFDDIEYSPSAHISEQVKQLIESRRKCAK